MAKISDINRAGFLSVPPVKEKYRWMLVGSISIHALAVLFVLYGGYLFPSSAIMIGTGPGGGTGGDSYTVGMVDELSGGAGMVKPSLIPQPPAFLEQEPPRPKAIPLPEPKASKKKMLTEKELKQAAKAIANSNIIPTNPEPGSGGSGGRSGGSGGGLGGGNGISIGIGSGGIGDSGYARQVEQRISENWDLPPAGIRVEMVYSFYISSNGTVTDIRLEKSSGIPAIDSNANRAIQLLNSRSNPLTPPPPEYRGRSIKFIAQFIYPPKP
jgi:TonB family protein